MIQQLCYNLTLYIMGYAFLLAGFSLSVHLRHMMAYFFGMALWVTVSTFLIISSIPLNLATVLSAYGATIAIILWFRRNGVLGVEKPSYGAINREAFWFLGYTALFILVNFIIFHLNLVWLSGDSEKYMGVGLDIARSGYFPMPEMSEADVVKFIRGRMVFLAALTAGSHFLDVEFYSSAFPLSAVYFLFTFALLFFVSSKRTGRRRWLRWLLGSCGALMIASIPAYSFHAYYVNQNLFVSIFFSICLVLIFIYNEQRKSQWLVLAAIALSATVLARAEMPIFSAIPIAMLMGTTDIDKKDYRLFLLVFLCISFPWQLFKLFHLGLVRGSHNWGLVQALVYLTYALSYAVVHFDASRKNIARITPNLLISLLICFIIINLYYSNQLTVSSMADLLQIIAISKGVHSWGVIWLAMGMVVVIKVSFLEEDGSDFWMKTLLIFFLIRIMLYSLGLFKVGSGSQFASGSRILIHILPAGVFYVFYVLANVLSDIRFDKHRAIES